MVSFLQISRLKSGTPSPAHHFDFHLVTPIISKLLTICILIFLLKIEG